MFKRILSRGVLLLAMIGYGGVFLFDLPLNLLLILLASTGAFLAIVLSEELTPLAGLDWGWAQD